jgi:predicted PurR-regulated permease PerM
MKINSKFIIAILSLLVVGAVIYYFSDIFAYVIIAWIVSMVGAPFVRLFSKVFSNTVSAGLTLFIFAIFFSLLGWIFVPTLIEQAGNLADVDYNKVSESLEEPIEDWNQWLVNKGLLEADEEITIEEVISGLEESPVISPHHIDVDSILSANGDSTMTSNISVFINVNPPDNNPPESILEPEKDVDFFTGIQNSLQTYLDPSKITSLFGNVLGFFSNFLIAILSIFFISFFFLKERGLFDNIITSLVPDEYVDKALNVIDGTSNMLIRYFIGVGIQIIVITLFVTTLLSILGVKNALLIGFFAALMNVIPYVGPIFGASFAVLITISSNIGLPFYTGMLPLLGKVIIVFVVMQLLDNFFLQPNIFSKSVKAHPLEIFLIVLVGAKLGGVLGMVLAIPAYTVFRVIGKEFLSNWKVVQSITRSI